MKQLIILPLFILSACSTNPSVSGGETNPSREGIRAAVRSQAREVQGCWKEHLRHYPNDEGRLVLAWTINPKGEAQDVRVEKEKTTLTNVIFQDCVVAQIKQTAFPVPQAGDEQAVVYPFAFRRLVEFQQ